MATSTGAASTLGECEVGSHANAAEAVCAALAAIQTAVCTTKNTFATRQHKLHTQKQGESLPGAGRVHTQAKASPTGPA